MTTIEQAAREWHKARKDLLEAISHQETWLKQGRNGAEAIQPPPLAPLWSSLASAESNLFKLIEAQP